MSDYHPVLQYAQYRLKDKTGVPMDLLTGNETHFALGNKVLPETSLKREADMLAQYTEWQKAEALRKRAMETAAEASKPTVTVAANASLGATSSSAAPVTAASPPTTSLPSPPVGGLQRSRTAEDVAASQELAVNEMMQVTAESKDVCIFYLESTNWDLDAAVELLRSMQVR